VIAACCMVVSIKHVTVLHAEYPSSAISLQIIVLPSLAIETEQFFSRGLNVEYIIQGIVNLRSKIRVQK
jgi:hypothetical protein